MQQKTDRFYPSAPLENNDLEQRLQKKVYDVNSFINHINNIKETITYFKDKNHKSKKKNKNYKTLNTILESVDSIAIIGLRATSITLSITGVGLILLLISAGIACTLSLGNKILHKLIINSNNNYKKRYEKDQQTIESFDKIYKNYLQDNVTVKIENECICNIFTEYVDRTKNESFYEHEYKCKIKLF